MFPHGSYLIGLSESLGEEINNADLSKITREDIRRWRGRYNMAGAHGVSSNIWTQVKARAKELGIDWDHYTPVSVGMTIEEPDEEEPISKVNKMVKTGDIIEDDSFEEESREDDSFEEESREDECVNNNEKPEFEEVDGRLVKPADEVTLDGETMYEVTVTFQTVVRIKADDPKEAISAAEDRIAEALDDNEIGYDDFWYSVKK